MYPGTHLDIKKMYSSTRKKLLVLLGKNYTEIKAQQLVLSLLLLLGKNYTEIKA